MTQHIPSRTPNGAAAAWLKANINFSGTACLIWPFDCGSDGYAKIHCASQPTTQVSRIVCSHQHGPPPTPRHQAAHSCKNGRAGCINGSHLRWATPKENIADRHMHGRTARGERHGAAKLTEIDVLAIRASNSPFQEIAETFGVSLTSISYIKNHKRWAWL